MKKTVLITGASGDIGKEIAKLFIENDYRVIGTYYKNHKSIKNLQVNLGSDFFYYQCDLSDFAQPETLLKKLKADNLSVDLLINNAGISLVGQIQDLTSIQWNQIWNTNVTSVVSMCRTFVPEFIRQKSGRIINISSVWGNNGASCETCYSATKGAVNSFTKALAKELGPSGIPVNAISCGIIDTKMNRHLTDDDIENIVKEIPLSKIGTAKDIAEAALSVANFNSYMTGQIITVDGGWQI